MPGGRPKVIDDKMADLILDLMKEGYPLSKVCERDDMPTFSTVWLKIRDDAEFSKKYREAREIGLDKSFENMLNECNEALTDDPKKAPLWKLYIDTKKWCLSKQLPKKYGDRIEIDQKTDLTIKNETKTMSDEELLQLAGSKN